MFYSKRHDICAVAGVVLVLATVCHGQTTNRVAKFNGAGGTTDSSIYDNGNIGVGTTVPIEKLDVNGAVSIGVANLDPNEGGDSYITPLGSTGKILIGWNRSGGYGEADFVANRGGGGGGGFTFFDYTNSGTLNQLMTLSGSGNVGIGTGTPLERLDVNGAVSIGYANLDPNLGGDSYINPMKNTAKMLIGWNRSGGYGETDFVANRGGGGSGGFSFYDYTNSGILNELMTLSGSGNIGIGTSSPATKLEVNGSVKLTSGSGASLTFPDGTNQTTAWTGALCGGDYAESVDVSEDRSHYQPGDVLVIDDDHPGNFLKSAQPYSDAVAGIYSTKPGMVGRRQKNPKTAEEIPMAMIGIVPVKVTAENGPIHLHDLLVSSATPGYAMKGTDRNRMLGAVIGKALGSLDSGTGTIEVLVTLQ